MSKPATASWCCCPQAICRSPNRCARFSRSNRSRTAPNPASRSRSGTPKACSTPAVRHVYERDGAALKRSGVDFNVSMLFGGQIKGEGMRLFQIYSAGNFVEATSETPYFQVGESKYGKPVLDRVLTPETPLNEAAKCALVSMDSTLKSNLSVGLPLDLVVYEVDRFATDKLICIDENNPYFRMLHDSWGQKLRQVFDSIEDPAWNGGSTQVPLMVSTGRNKPLRKITNHQDRLI